MQRETQGIDRFFLTAVMSLITIGVIMIVSTSSVVGASNYQNSYFFIQKHLIYLILGMFVFMFGFLMPHKNYKKMLFPGILLSVFLLICTFIPGIGIKVGGANRWINLFFFQLQPVEIAKFVIVIYLASFLDNKEKIITSFWHAILPVFLVIGLYLFILFKQPDMGNIILLLMMVAIILFISNMRLRYLFGIMLASCLVVIISVLNHPYQLERIRAFLFPENDPLGRNYHVLQSLIAIGSGGLFGLGLGQSKLKYFYLPLQYSDFIYSIICEEGGFILGGIVVLLLALLFYRGLKISFNANSKFSMFLGLGLTLLLVIQSVINIGVVIGLFPVTGIPLTFVSFGGTSLITSMFYAGIILNISKTK